MKSCLKILVSTIVICSLFQNCQEESYEPKKDFQADLLVKSLICYPDDSISLRFELSPKDGTEPYSYQWIIPDTLEGSGPFTVNLKEDLKILVKITDANSKQLDYSLTIKKDTIDSLKYDYRNLIVGKYLCDYEEWYPTLTDTGWVQIKNNYRDTLVIANGEQFSNLVCGYYNELSYTGKTNRFTYVWGSVSSSVYVRNDSVYYTYSRLARYGLKGTGKKINN